MCKNADKNKHMHMDRIVVMTHQVVYSNTVPSLHDRQEGYNSGNHPTSTHHQSHSQWCHFVSVDKGLTANGIIPGN